MKISTTTGRFNVRYDLKTAIDVLSVAGYDALDFSQFDKEVYEASLSDDYYREMRKYAEDKGVYFNQSHAPFGSSYKDEEKTKQRFMEITEAMKRASLLGVRSIIVHPCQHLSYSTEGNPERLFEYNMDFYKRLVPYCEEYGIKVALENMWQNTGFINHSTCSRPEEFIRYLDELNNECFVACLDIGHAALVREDPDVFIERLGAKRLKCLHVHDVDGVNDSHTLPFFGCIDWEKVMSALARIGYEGELTFEADNFLNDKPAELYEDCERLMAKTGRYLAGLFEESKRVIK